MMIQPIHPMFELSEGEISGIVPVPADRDESAEWEESLFVEKPPRTSFTAAELVERRKMFRKLVGAVMAGATMLLALAGVRDKARPHHKMSHSTPLVLVGGRAGGGELVAVVRTTRSGRER
jgi:hypothetical protein